MRRKKIGRNFDATFRIVRLPFNGRSARRYHSYLNAIIGSTLAARRAGM